jgi:uncharacterized repeat protein (TIGR03943 family)
VRRPVQALLLALSGLGLLQATLFSDLYLRYVKEGMRPLLVASGVVLLALGAAEGWSCAARLRRAPAAGGSPASPGDTPDHGHDHGHGPPWVAWLLFLPALSLLFWAPPALGAYTASRETPQAVPVTDQDDFDPLPATSPLPLTLGDFTRRVQQDRSRAVQGRTVLMAGFVTPDGSGDGWYLTRLILNCCAADAQSVKVRVHGVAAPKADTWVAVTGTWHPSGTLGTSSAEAGLDARTVERIARPSNGYTDGPPLVTR